MLSDIIFTVVAGSVRQKDIAAGTLGKTLAGSLNDFGRMFNYWGRGVAWFNTLPCQGRDRGFKSRRPRINVSLELFGKFKTSKSGFLADRGVFVFLLSILSLLPGF